MRNLFKIIIPVVILILAGALTMFMVKQRSAPQRVQEKEQHVLVRVLEAEFENRNSVISSTGTVREVREAEISAEVSGRIEYVSEQLLPGKVLDKGEVIVRVDDRDYRFAIQNARAEVARAELELARIESSAAVARREWEMFQDKDTEKPAPLVLYEPQLKNARAALDSARARLEQARLNLERTVIRSPFVSLVRSQNAAPGRYITPGSPVTVLAEIEKAEVIVHLPQSDVRWIDIPGPEDKEPGSEVLVRVMGKSRDSAVTGRISRSLGRVDPQTRMLGIVVEVEDPYAVSDKFSEHESELAFGSFVQVEITGPELEDVVVLPRQALRENSTVWIADKDDRLEIRDVSVKRFQEDQVMISSGIQSGERIILTNISAPAQGMKIKADPNHE
ncbi:MAG: efflux RND transporter periplasmic adaptor subunit [Desulfonatronovibrio sp.]